MRRSTKEPLTPRQLEIAQWTACGLLDKEIANRMNVSVSTVTNTKRNIYDKYGFNNTSELIAFYFATYHKVSTDFDLVGKIKRAVSGLILTLLICSQMFVDNNQQRVRRSGRRSRHDYEVVEFADLEEESDLEDNDDKK